MLLRSFARPAGADKRFSSASPLYTENPSETTLGNARNSVALSASIGPYRRQLISVP
jgi:hypothetical protein